MVDVTCEFETLWTYHGESEGAREAVVRQRTEDYDTGVGDMLDDFRDAHMPHVVPPVEQDPEPTAKAFYDMLSAATQPLHKHTQISRLDAILCLMTVKSQHSVCRSAFDAFLTVIGTLLQEPHHLPQNMYELTKMMCALKMPFEQIHAYPKGSMLFRKEHADAKYYVKYKSSSYVEVDAGDGQKSQLTVAAKILRYLPPILRIRRLYMTEEYAKQMTWHEDGHRYHPDKLLHPSDGEVWRTV
jgi:hypothetical protein